LTSAQTVSWPAWNKGASEQASLDALTASVEDAKKKDQEEATRNQPYYDAKRDLEQKLDMHKLLYSKLEAEKLDLISRRPAWCN